MSLPRGKYNPGVITITCGNCASDDIVVNEIKWNSRQGVIVTIWCRDCLGVCGLSNEEQKS